MERRTFHPQDLIPNDLLAGLEEYLQEKEESFSVILSFYLLGVDLGFGGGLENNKAITGFVGTSVCCGRKIYWRRRRGGGLEGNMTCEL